MTTIACPRCTNCGPRLLESVSNVSAVTYYRCTECSHVWAINKENPGEIHHVTPLDRRTTEAKSIQISPNSNSFREFDTSVENDRQTGVN